MSEDEQQPEPVAEPAPAVEPIEEESDPDNSSTLDSFDWFEPNGDPDKEEWADYFGKPNCRWLARHEEELKINAYAEILNNQDKKKQIIFYGPPGTGKTHIAKKLAYRIREERDGGRWSNTNHKKIVQFHPSYSYEDFVQGIKPVRTAAGEIDYKLQAGIFQKMCLSDETWNRMTWRAAAIFVLHRAEGPLHFREITRRSIGLGINPAGSENTATPWFTQLREMTEDIRNNGDDAVFRRTPMPDGTNVYGLNDESEATEQAIQDLPRAIIDTTNKVLIIDEINRGNLPKIFGELIYALEYREEEVDLQYKEFDPSSPLGKLTIPDYLHIIGTMNTADRSIILFDTALRRRFSFIPLFPDYELLARTLDIDTAFDEAGFRRKLDDPVTSENERNKIVSVLALHKINELLIAQPAIGREKQIGHTFLLELQKRPENFVKVWQRDIIPLLEEYYFDGTSVLANWFPGIFTVKDGIQENFTADALYNVLNQCNGWQGN